MKKHLAVLEEALAEAVREFKALGIEDPNEIPWTEEPPPPPGKTRVLEYCRTGEPDELSWQDEITCFEVNAIITSGVEDFFLWFTYEELTGELMGGC